MERETNTKIAIRGKGSVKEGRLKNSNSKPDPSDDEELHVLITAETDEAADKVWRHTFAGLPYLSLALLLLFARLSGGGHGAAAADPHG